MDVRYFARNVEIPDSIKDHIEKKMSKLEKFFDRIQDAQISFNFTRGMHIAEITANVNGLVVRGEDYAQDLRKAFDKALKNIEKQIKRHKNYLVDKVKMKNRDVSFDLDFDTNHDIQDDSSSVPEIIKKKRFSVRAMTSIEATMQMDLLGHDFFVYKNPDTGEMNIVYRRRNGGYGLLEPE